MAAMLQVTEIFLSIQGESTFAGCPCVFVRLSGCNLRCHYCDTRYAYASGQAVSIPEILVQATSLGTEMVEVTGGEPLLQPATHALLEALDSHYRTVLLETNGSVLLPERRRHRTIMDLKCPSSGQSDAVQWRNLTRLQSGDELKFVISERADFDWAVARIRELKLDRLGIPLLFSPVAQVLDPRSLAEWILGCEFGIRLQLQLHKIIWPERDRGV